MIATRPDKGIFAPRERIQTQPGPCTLPGEIFMTNGNGAPSEQAPPQLNVLAQYTKDLSFENPNAPSSLAPQQQQPAINIQINIGVGQLSTTDYEVSLKLEGKAEGTDATILRAGEIINGHGSSRGRTNLSSGPLTVLKLSKPDQDMRFDVPVIGLPSIENMIQAGATAIHVSAGKTLLFDRDELIALADRNGISAVAGN